MPMPGLLADLVVVVHLAFILFVALGGLSVLRWPAVAWAHLPALAWGVWIGFSESSPDSALATPKSMIFAMGLPSCSCTTA